MKFDQLKKMKMPGAGKPSMALEVALGKPKSMPGEGMDSGDHEDQEEGKGGSLADASDMDLLEELKERGCVDDSQYDSISKHIQGESHSDEHEGDAGDLGEENKQPGQRRGMEEESY